MEKEGVWWIAKVKPRQEKVFAFELFKQGIDYYLPYCEKKTQRPDGKFRKSYLILFPSYVPFIAETTCQFWANRSIIAILPIKGQARFRYQLHIINSATESGCRILPWQSNRYAVGDLVSVILGPFAGFRGHIFKMQKDDFVVINVDGLGSALLNVEASQIVKVELNSVATL
jgi:hypothetical protein